MNINEGWYGYYKDGDIYFPIRYKWKPVHNKNRRREDG